jgi:hypothetical protein
MAWSNRGTDLFAVSAQPSELLPRQLQPTTTLNGEGPPGGVAVLRVDGRPVAPQTIGARPNLRVPGRAAPLPSAESAGGVRLRSDQSLGAHRHLRGDPVDLGLSAARRCGGGSGRRRTVGELSSGGAVRRRCRRERVRRLRAGAGGPQRQSHRIEGVAQRTPNSTQGLAGWSRACPPDPPRHWAWPPPRTAGAATARSSTSVRRGACWPGRSIAPTAFDPPCPPRSGTTSSNGVGRVI